MNCIKVISIQLTTSKENPTKWVPKVGCDMKDGYELKVQRKTISESLITKNLARKKEAKVDYLIS